MPEWKVIQADRAHGERKYYSEKYWTARGLGILFCNRKVGHKSLAQDFLIASSTFLLRNFLGKLMKNAWETFHAEQAAGL